MGFRKGGVQLFGPLGRRTQLEVVLGGLLLTSLLALFGCAITLGVRYNRGNTHTHKNTRTHSKMCVMYKNFLINMVPCNTDLYKAGMLL